MLRLSIKAGALSRELKATPMPSVGFIAHALAATARWMVYRRRRRECDNWTVFACRSIAYKILNIDYVIF